jgi:hypothetical protein
MVEGGTGIYIFPPAVRKVVDDDYGMTVVYQQIGNVGGDKTRPAGNQNFHVPLLWVSQV